MIWSRDAWSFADALRLDGQGWKALKPEEPLIKELRLQCRDEVSLIEQRTAFIQQLRHALAEYYPAALEAFKDWTSVLARMFLQRFPTAQALAQAGKRKWQNFLHSRRLILCKGHQAGCEVIICSDAIVTGENLQRLL